jgi:glutamine synthetase
MALEGMLTPDALGKRVEADEIDTVLVMFTDSYGRFMGKRCDARFFLENVLKEGTHACDYLLTVDMEMEPVPGYDFANWEKGYGDFHLVPDLATLRVADWLEKSALVICDVKGVGVAPRSILRSQVDRVAEAGFTPFGASELEYYVFETSYREAATRGFHELPQAGWYLEDYHMLQGRRHEKLTAPVRRHLRRSGIPVETSKGEWGLGQHELNIRYTNALWMADRHVLYKQCIKEVADGLDMSVTFMAKLDQKQAGSSCHLHLSLWNGDKSAFAGESDTFRHFLAGWIAHVPDVMVFYAPTVNSYKRYRAASWAPTRLGWSNDNRTAGFRVVGEGNGLRIECRIPGADCNPYLAFAAALASGMDGIEKKLEPPPIFEGDIYKAESLPSVPPTLRDATDLFEASDFAGAAFGEEVVKHYTHFFRTEQAACEDAVTDWERRRYFERI